VSPEDFNPRARAAIEWTRSAIDSGGDGQGAQADRLWNYLGGLVPNREDERAQFVHGSPRDPVREYVLPSDARRPEKMSALFRSQTRPVCFVGHSHVPAVYYQDQRFFRPRGTQGPFQIGASDDNRVLINVGSVGQPRDSDPRSSYALYDGEHVTFVRLEYDVAGAQADIRRIPALPESLAERLAVGR
jgi:diadenosine tetraphosphatase ApaH/serine/threonine PP2A family protein phosphatase